MRRSAMSESEFDAHKATVLGVERVWITIDRSGWAVISQKHQFLFHFNNPCLFFLKRKK